MKKVFSVVLLIFILMSFSSCKTESKTEKEFDSFTYTHFASGGNPEEETAIVLFEHANTTFTSYQIAFISCTCRDTSVNYYSVLYIELLNNKENPDDAAIRSITFGDNKGLWGDSNPTYGTTDYTPEYFDENFIQPLVKKTKKDFDAWGGYKTQVDGIDVDAVTGASVSTSNITSVIQSLFKYHTEKYYG